MICEIRKYGDPVLYLHAETVEKIGTEEIDILTDMWDTMIHNRCVGLSAPQIGVSKCLFIVNIGGVTIRGGTLKFSKKARSLKRWKEVRAFRGSSGRPADREKSPTDISTYPANSSRPNSKGYLPGLFSMKKTIMKGYYSLTT